MIKGFLIWKIKRNNFNLKLNKSDLFVYNFIIVYNFLITCIKMNSFNIIVNIIILYINIHTKFSFIKMFKITIIKYKFKLK